MILIDVKEEEEEEEEEEEMEEEEMEEKEEDFRAEELFISNAIDIIQLKNNLTGDNSATPTIYI